MVNFKIRVAIWRVKYAILSYFNLNLKAKMLYLGYYLLKLIYCKVLIVFLVRPETMFTLEAG